MKNYIKYPLVLGSIALCSGLLIGGLYVLTSPTIMNNIAREEEAALVSIYSSSSDTPYIYNVVEREFDNDLLKKVWTVSDSDNLIGLIYRASGKNPYGSISLMIGFNVEGAIHGEVKLIENTQSFANEVNTWMTNTDFHNIDTIDTKCGATYGAELVKELIKAAHNDVLKGGF